MFNINKTYLRQMKFFYHMNGGRKSRELSEMIKVFSTLTNGRGFLPCSGYGTALKFVVSIYPLNKPTKYERLIIGFVPINILKN